MLLQKISDDNNAYGFKFIHIIAFNYDGDGNTLCYDYSDDGTKHLTTYGKVDLDIILSLDESNPTWTHPIYKVIVN